MYLDIVNRASIAATDIRDHLSDQQLKPLSTHHLIYSQQIIEAKQILSGHFSGGESRTRPLNCLILGPPGSGKSFLAKKLASKSLTGEREPWLLEYNLSQFGSVADLSNMFDKITRENSLNSLSPGVVLIDEFDVRIGGVSAIQALISPIYDRKDFRNIAFVFSGSYLKNRKMLGTQLDSALEFDLRHCLSVYRLYLVGKEDRKLLAELDRIFWRLEQKEVRDPDQSVLNYLAGLEKVIDFRSRINGFVIEIPDLDSPLDVTTDPFKLCQPRSGHLEPSIGIGDLIMDYVDALEGLDKKSEAWTHPLFTRIDEPLLQFKDMLLTERLGRVVFMIRERWAKTKKDPVAVKRGTLSFLATVPVRHGMRSVEYLISQCTDEQGFVEFPDNGAGTYMLQLHTRNVQEFRDPHRVWQKLKDSNPTHETWRPYEETVTLKPPPAL